MYRAAAIVTCALFLAAAVAAQQPRTTDAQHVVNELYRHTLERQPDTASTGWVQQLENGRMSGPQAFVDRLVTSSEYSQRYGMVQRGVRTLPTTGRTILVEAWERWSDTGIDVQPRDLLLFDANGTIRVDDDDDRDVATADGAGGHRSVEVPMLTQRAGALIGRIGHGPPFFVGSSRAVLAPTIGRLYLGVNDDDFRDNVGYFEVMITIQ